MQSDVWHDLHVSRSTIRSSVGDIVEAVKLNWPIGQTYLQNDAPEKSDVHDDARRPK